MLGVILVTRLALSLSKWRYSLDMPICSFL